MDLGGVSAQSWLWRRKFSHNSCWDLSSQCFDHESGAPTNKISPASNCVYNTPNHQFTKIHWITEIVIFSSLSILFKQLQLLSFRKVHRLSETTSRFNQETWGECWQSTLTLWSAAVEPEVDLTETTILAGLNSNQSWLDLIATKRFPLACEQQWKPKFRINMPKVRSYLYRYSSTCREWCLMILSALSCSCGWPVMKQALQNGGGGVSESPLGYWKSNCFP